MKMRAKTSFTFITLKQTLSGIVSAFQSFFIFRANQANILYRLTKNYIGEYLREYLRLVKMFPRDLHSNCIGYYERAYDTRCKKTTAMS